MIGTLRWPGNSCMQDFGSFFCWKSSRPVAIDAAPLPSGECPSSSAGTTSMVSATTSVTSSRGQASVTGTGETTSGSGEMTGSAGQTTGGSGQNTEESGQSTIGYGGSSGTQNPNTGETSGAAIGVPGPSGSVTGPATNTGAGVGIGPPIGGTSQNIPLPTDSEGMPQSGAKPPQSSGHATYGTFTLTSAALPPSGSQPISVSNSIPNSDASNTVPGSFNPTDGASTDNAGSSNV